MRQVVLDTETTGMRLEDGNRIIEIGCLELINRRLTDQHFHVYLNPDREIEAGALAVHGITSEFLKDKPRFTDIVEPFLQFIAGAELIIHNAPFDLAYLNAELALVSRSLKTVMHHAASVIDTLKIARELHAGQRNNLDALCKRYGVDRSKREYHGALLDADLLAQVYLAMTGGQSSFFETNTMSGVETIEAATTQAPIQRTMGVITYATSEEASAHARYLEMLKKKGRCVWEPDVST